MTATDAKPRTPRWKEIYRSLKKELPNYTYGSNFYTIAQICEKFDVSTITATRVLQELESEGMVQKIRRRGTVVRRVDQEMTVWMPASARLPADWPHFDSRWARLITAASHFARRHGIRFELIGESHLPSLLRSQTERFGVLLTSGLSAEHIRSVREGGRPHVFLDTRIGPRSGPWARLDRRAVSALAVRHLVDLGHRRIAMVLGSITERGWRHRLLGYRAALEQAGLPFRWDYIADANIVEPPADVESGVDAMSRATAQFKSQIRVAFDRIMASPRKPTAIIAGDDRRAAMLLDICCERGVHVPGDLSIVGFPNSPESRLTTPPLTVVDGCYEQISEAAMQMLLDQMFQGADPYAQQAVIQPRLVVRASTAKPSGLRKKNNVDTAENSKNLESRR